LLTVSFFSGFTKNDTKESQWTGEKVILTSWADSTSSFTNKNGAAYVAVLRAYKKSNLCKTTLDGRNQANDLLGYKKQLQIVG